MIGSTMARVRALASVFISFDFELPANCGPGIMIDTTVMAAPKMSRVVGTCSLSFSSPRSVTNRWTASVTAVRNPAMCMPPSGVETPLA